MLVVPFSIGLPISGLVILMIFHWSSASYCAMEVVVEAGDPGTGSSWVSKVFMMRGFETSILGENVSDIFLKKQSKLVIGWQ